VRRGAALDQRDLFQDPKMTVNIGTDRFQLKDSGAHQVIFPDQALFVRGIDYAIGASPHRRRICHVEASCAVVARLSTSFSKSRSDEFEESPVSM